MNPHIIALAVLALILITMVFVALTPPPCTYRCKQCRFDFFNHADVIVTPEHEFVCLNCATVHDYTPALDEEDCDELCTCPDCTSNGS